MSLEEMKEKFESGNYISIWKYDENIYDGIIYYDGWMEDVDQGYFENKDASYKLIHKKHKDILDAYLKDDSVEIEFAVMPVDSSREWKDLELDFIYSYDEKNIYQLKDTQPKLIEVTKEDFENGNLFCVANEEHYKKLIDDGMKSQTLEYLEIDTLYFQRDANRFRASSLQKTAHSTKGYIEIQLINNKWYFKGEDDERQKDKVCKQEALPSDSISSEAMQIETISAPSSDVKFLKPEFECEILKEVKDGSIGYVIDEDGYAGAIHWLKSGLVDESIIDEYILDKEYRKYNLTPYKEKLEWYEDEGNFPCVMFNGKTKCFFVLNSILDWTESFRMVSKYRLATKEEIESLIVKESK